MPLILSTITILCQLITERQNKNRKIRNEIEKKSVKNGEPACRRCSCPNIPR